MLSTENAVIEILPGERERQHGGGGVPQFAGAFTPRGPESRRLTGEFGIDGTIIDCPQGKCAKSYFGGGKSMLRKVNSI